MDLEKNLLENGLAPLTAAVAAAIVLFDVIKGKLYLKCSANLLKERFVLLVTVVLSLVLLGSGAQSMAFGAFTSFTATLMLVLGALATFILASIGLKLPTASMLHLALACLVNQFVPSELATDGPILYSVGLLLMRLVLNLRYPAEAELMDVSAAFAYLASAAFVRQNVLGMAVPKARGIVECAFITTSLLTLFQRPFTFDDKIWVKRLTLCVTGAVFFLAITTKLLLAVEFSKLAILFGGVLAVSYLADSFAPKQSDGKEKGTTGSSITQLLLCGIVFLVASRLFGNLGVAVCAATTLIGINGFGNGLVTSALGLFFGARIIEQYFSLNYVANCTGINILHPYVGASVYFGFFVILALGLLLKDALKAPRPLVLLSVFAVWATIGTLVANYFLHAEAAAGYLVSLTVAALMMAVMGQSFFAGNERTCLNLILLPAVASVVAVAGAPLLELGEGATIAVRLNILCVVAVLALLSGVCGFLLDKRSAGKSNGATT